MDQWRAELGEAVWLGQGCCSGARQRAWPSRLTHIRARRQVGIARWSPAARGPTSAEDVHDTRPEPEFRKPDYAARCSVCASASSRGPAPLLVLPSVDPGVVVIPRKDPPEHGEPWLPAPAVGVTVAGHETGCLPGTVVQGQRQITQDQGSGELPHAHEPRTASSSGQDRR